MGERRAAAVAAEAAEVAVPAEAAVPAEVAAPAEAEGQERTPAAQPAPPGFNEPLPADPEVYSYIHTRTSPGWRRLPKDDYVRKVTDRGHRLPFKRRFTPRGFNQPCTGRLDQQFVMERVVEASRSLHTSAYRVAPCQDASELVAQGHMITPTFMVDKIGTTKKRMVHNQKRSNVGVRKKSPNLEDARILYMHILLREKKMGRSRTNAVYPRGLSLFLCLPFLDCNIQISNKYSLITIEV